MFLRSRKAEAIGAIGEKRVARILSGIPNSRLLTNVLIPHATGTSEIDAILVTPKQLYVIESKNYSASSSITGSLVRYEWTQTIKRKGSSPTKRKIYNPVKQNQTHLSRVVRFLQAKGLRIRESDCHSVIVFSAGCTLKKIPPKLTSFYHHEGAFSPKHPPAPYVCTQESLYQHRGGKHRQNPRKQNPCHEEAEENAHRPS